MSRSFRTPFAGRTSNRAFIVFGTFCSHLAMRGAPARSIQELAGHQGLATPQRYMHVSPAAIGDAMPAVIDRDTNFVEQAVRAGAFDALTRTQALRQLADTGRAVDTAIREYRAARAAWVRRSLQ